MKDFGIWHAEKSRIEALTSRVFFHEREIWWCHFGNNIGYEQDGKGPEFARPALIVTKFNNEVFWAVPITTKNKFGKFYEQVFLNDRVYRTSILSQMRLIDGKRLIKKIGSISEGNMERVKMKIHQLLGGSSSFLPNGFPQGEAEAVNIFIISES